LKVRGGELYKVAVGRSEGLFPVPLNDFLREMALRCDALSRSCPDESIKIKLRQLSDDLLRKANDIEATSSPAFKLPPLHK
jgi:hypothetical protein